MNCTVARDATDRFWMEQCATILIEARARMLRLYMDVYSIYVDPRSLHLRPDSINVRLTLILV